MLETSCQRHKTRDVKWKKQVQYIVYPCVVTQKIICNSHVQMREIFLDD